MRLSTMTKSFPAPEAFVKGIAMIMRSNGMAWELDTKILQKCQVLLQKQKSSHTESFIVEMAGVEPASEERTIKPTTYIVLSFTPRSTASDRQDTGKATSNVPVAGFRVHCRRRCAPSLPEVGASSRSSRRDLSRRAT